MAAGTTYKQCSCRDDHGRRLGQKCARLRRANGAWSSRHGTWYYQLELPPNPDGSRRNPLRRGGFATQDDPDQELAAARDLLATAPPATGRAGSTTPMASTGPPRRPRTSPTRPRSATQPG